MLYYKVHDLFQLCDQTEAYTCNVKQLKVLFSQPMNIYLHQCGYYEKMSSFILKFHPGASAYTILWWRRELNGWGWTEALLCVAVSLVETSLIPPCLSSSDILLPLLDLSPNCISPEVGNMFYLYIVLRTKPPITLPMVWNIAYMFVCVCVCVCGVCVCVWTQCLFVYY